MKSHEAIQKAINGKTIEHAKRMGKSVSLISKWQEPTTDFSESGALNPLDRIEAIVEKSLALGNSFEDATAPIKYLEEKFNIIGIPRPVMCLDANAISQELLKTVHEFAEMTEAASKALADGYISTAEFINIEKEGWELIRQVTEFMYKAKESVK